jgi:hypothetical protein
MTCHWPAHEKCRQGRRAEVESSIPVRSDAIIGVIFVVAQMIELILSFNHLQASVLGRVHEQAKDRRNPPSIRLAQVTCAMLASPGTWLSFE